MPRTRNHYPTEFGNQIVTLVRSRHSIESLAREFEPRAVTIHGWIKNIEIDERDRHYGLSGEERGELLRLLQYIGQLGRERDIL